MKTSLRTSFNGSRQSAGGSRQRTILPCIYGSLPTAYCLLLAVTVTLTGCESLQRKLTRKPKHPAERPSPIINFQDYGQAMTPLDRYRKHYLMFDYWSGELIESLQKAPLNSKRIKRDSSESLAELKTMKDLLVDDVALRFEPLVEERTKINSQVESGTIGPSDANTLSQALEAQTRQIHREFFWRDVQEHLKP